MKDDLEFKVSLSQVGRSCQKWKEGRRGGRRKRGKREGKREGRREGREEARKEGEGGKER
jgi:hypothetical protein